MLKDRVWGLQYVGRNGVAAVLSMTKQDESARHAAPSRGAETGLEEARLRQQAIGVKLRHLFDEVVNEPVPDEFLDILRRADEKAGEGGA